MRTDWMPHTRPAQLAMAKRWMDLLPGKEDFTFFENFLKLSYLHYIWCRNFLNDTTEIRCQAPFTLPT